MNEETLIIAKERNTIESLFKRSRVLKQYKSLSDSELLEIVKTKIDSKIEKVGNKELDDLLDIEDMFVDKEEKKEAKKLLNKYLNTYTIDSISEKNTLKQLVFLEVFNNRLQRELNKYHSEGQPSPPKTIESLHSNLNQISSLKEKIGLCNTKKDRSLNEGYAIIDTLYKKWSLWRSENQGSRSLNCPHCGKMIMLKIRTDAWEAQKHPFFKDRILANPHLLELYRLNKITTEDVALVLGTSTDYIQWLIKKIYFKEFNIIKENIEDLETKEDKISFIKPNSFLNKENLEPLVNINQGEPLSVQ